MASKNGFLLRRLFYSSLFILIPLLLVSIIFVIANGDLSNSSESSDSYEKSSGYSGGCSKPGHKP